MRASRRPTGSVLAFTDDDVRASDGWLDAAATPLLGSDPSIAYTGGPVRPIWEADPPAWLDLTRGDLWGTIAIQNHGDTLVHLRGRTKGAARRQHGGPA